MSATPQIHVQVFIMIEPMDKMSPHKVERRQPSMKLSEGLWGSQTDNTKKVEISDDCGCRKTTTLLVSERWLHYKVTI